MKKYITTNNLLIVLIILSSFNIFMNFRIFEEQATVFDVKMIREPLKKLHSIEKEVELIEKIVHNMAVFSTMVNPKVYADFRSRRFSENENTFFDTYFGFDKVGDKDWYKKALDLNP